MTFFKNQASVQSPAFSLLFLILIDGKQLSEKGIYKW